MRSLVNIFLLGLICSIYCGVTLAAVEESHDEKPANGESHGNDTDTKVYRNGTGSGGHAPEEEHHDDEEEEHHGEEEHHAGHAIVWPSAIGMMIFISGSGYLFYHFYTRYQTKKVMMEEKHDASFFQQAIVSSAVTGVAAPGMISFDDIN